MTKLRGISTYLKEYMWCVSQGKPKHFILKDHISFLLCNNMIDIQDVYHLETEELTWWVLVMGHRER